MSHFVPPSAYPVLLALIVVFGLYLAWEVWRWAAGNRAALERQQFRRRVAAGLLLETDLVLWLLANSITRGRPPAQQLLYVMGATLLVLLPMMIAVREAAFVMRQYARWRGEMVKHLGDRDRGGS